MDVSISDNSKRIARNAIFMYIRMLVVILVSLYTTRVVLKTLGIDDYGIYNVVGGIVILFAFINQGLAGATKRYVMAELAVGDLFSQRKIYSIAINAHILISIIIFLIGESIGLYILYNLMNIPPDRMFAASILYQVSLFTSILTILQSPFSSVVISHEKMSVYAYISIIDVLLKLGIVFLVQIIEKDKLITYSILMMLISILNIFFYFGYCHHKFEMCRYDIKIKDNSAFKSLFEYVGWTIFGTGANVLSRQGTSILVNNFFSVAVNSAMGISNTIVHTASQFVNNFQIAFGPQITKNYISQNYIELNRLVLRSCRYSSLLILLILIPVSIVISDLLNIWLGEYPPYTEEFCVLTLVCVYFESISSPLTGVITSDKKIGRYQSIISIAYLLSLLFCWLVLLIGTPPYYVVIVRLIIDFLLIAIRLIMIKKKVYSFDISNWCKIIFLKSFQIIVICLPLYGISKILILHNPLSRLLIYGGIGVIWVLGLIWIIGLTSKEKQFAASKIFSTLNVKYKLNK